MEIKKKVLSAVSLIQNHFTIDENELVIQDATIEELEKELSQLISRLLDSDMERLILSLYRIDIDEAIFKKILVNEPSDNISLRLAQEVIKREFEKVRTREKYKDFFQ